MTSVFQKNIKLNSFYFIPAKKKKKKKKKKKFV